jgi:hypothetical protein
VRCCEPFSSRWVRFGYGDDANILWMVEYPVSIGVETTPTSTD